MVKRLRTTLATRRPLVALTVLLVLGMLLSVIFQQRAEAAPYVNPFWANYSGAQESAIQHIANLSMSPEGVDVVLPRGSRIDFAFDADDLGRQEVIYRGPDRVGVWEELRVATYATVPPTTNHALASVVRYLASFMR